MFKKDEIENLSSCWNKALPEEPVFVLLGRDAAASHAIKCWVDERIRLKLDESYTSEKILDAIRCEKLMLDYRITLKRPESSVQAGYNRLLVENERLRGDVEEMRKLATRRLREINTGELMHGFFVENSTKLIAELKDSINKLQARLEVSENSPIPVPQWDGRCPATHASGARCVFRKGHVSDTHSAIVNGTYTPWLFKLSAPLTDDPAVETQDETQPAQVLHSTLVDLQARYDALVKLLNDAKTSPRSDAYGDPGEKVGGY